MIDNEIFQRMLVRYRNYIDLSQDFIEKIEESNKQKVIELEVVGVQEPGVFHLQFFGERSNVIGEASIVYHQGLITGILDFGRNNEEVFPFEVSNKSLKINNLIQEFEKYIQVDFINEI